MPRSSTCPRGLSSARPGREPLAERQQVVLVAAGPVQHQQREARGGIGRRLEMVDERFHADSR
jgi:hypothetical protein